MSFREYIINTCVIDVVYTGKQQILLFEKLLVDCSISTEIFLEQALKLRITHVHMHMSESSQISEKRPTVTLACLLQWLQLYHQGFIKLVFSDTKNFMIM